MQVRGEGQIKWRIKENVNVKSCKKQYKVYCIYCVEDKKWKWCKWGRVDDREACMYMCLSLCNVGLMSWTVCHPPTVGEEYAVIQKDSCISAQLSLSLFLTAGGRQPPLPSSNKPPHINGTHTQTQPSSLNRRTIKTSHGIRRRKWDEMILKYELFFSSPFPTTGVCGFTCFSPLLRGVWQKMYINESPQALYNTLIMGITLRVFVCVINYLHALFLFLSECHNSPNNKKQAVKPTYRAHILKTLKVPLHTLQL